MLESREATARRTEGAGAAHKWLVIGAVSISTAMIPMEDTMVNVALPILARVFDVTLTQIIWVQLAYMLTATGLMLTWGRLGDTMGRRRMYLAGFIVYAVGLISSSLAQDFFHLVASRILQAIGAAMATAMGTAITAAAFPSQERGKALGIIQATIGAGLTTGPALGGLLIDTLGWRSIFWIRIPLALLGIALGWIALPKESDPPRRSVKMDIRGAATLFLGVSALILAINQGQARGWTSPLVMAMSAMAPTMLFLFLFAEKGAKNPVLNLKFFRVPAFAGASTSLFLRFLALRGFMLLMPFYLIQARGYAPATTGLIITAMPLTMVIVSPFSGWLSDRVGTRPLSVGGLALMCLGLFAAANLDQGSSVVDVLLRLLVIGIGGSIFETPTNSALMGSVPRDQFGTAAAMTATSRTLGQTTGLAAAGTIFAARQLFYTQQLAGNVSNADTVAVLAFIGGFHDTILVGLGIGVLALLAAFFGGGRRSPPPTA
ncbi:MAG: MFS transporter [Chloroflexi bacterium]|nr:MFS transporter [Chloroflexota bacterium]